MIIHNLIESENYIKEHNYKKIFSINLYCCQFTLYENATDCFHQFICYNYIFNRT